MRQSTTADPMSFYDVIIIGGGPVGLSAALLLARACRRVIVIDAGHPRNAAARELHGFLGRDGTDPRKLLHDGRAELARYSVEIIQDVACAAEPLAQMSRKHPTAFVVTTQGGLALAGRKLLFATGVCDDLPDLPGFRECYGRSVHHCPYCDAWEHRGKQLIAFGHQADDAAGLGIALRGWSDQVTVLSHGDPISSAVANRLLRNGIAFDPTRVSHLVVAEDQILKAVAMEDGREVAADAVFFNTAQRACSDLPAALGCETDDAHRGKTQERQRTCVAGVFLAGDADGDVQFAIIAAAEGATAAVTINRQLQDEDRSV